MISAQMREKGVLVTGGASGIGRAAVELFAANGAKVALNHLPNDNRGPEVVQELRGRGLDVVSAPGDVSLAEDVVPMVEEAVRQLGRLDVLINNAGTANTVEPIALTDLDAMDEAFWQSILSTNLLGPFRCARAAAAHLKKTSGAIVSTASVSGLGVRGSSIAYAASKAALINLTTNLAKALAPQVRVNAVAPGLVRTPWTDPWPEERKRRSVENTLLKRMVEADEIASAMLFLSVHTAINAQTIVIDCGREN